MAASTWLRSVVALGVCLLVPKLAAATNISIKDLDLRHTITITSANFDGGFIATVTVTSESGAFIGTWTANQTATGAAPAFFTEGNPNHISDILSVFYFSNPAGRIETIIGVFTPDTDDPSSFVEDGTFQDVTALLGSPPNLTIKVPSDVEPATVPKLMPEPTTLLLLGTGIAGLAVWLAVQSRRKRAA